MHHKKCNQAEIDYIKEEGGIPELGSENKKTKISLLQLKQVCVNRMMIGVYIGQFCLTSITWFCGCNSCHCGFYWRNNWWRIF